MANNEREFLKQFGKKYHQLFLKIVSKTSLRRDDSGTRGEGGEMRLTRVEIEVILARMDEVLRTWWYPLQPSDRGIWSPKIIPGPRCPSPI